MTSPLILADLYRPWKGSSPRHEHKIGNGKARHAADLAVKMKCLSPDSDDTVV